MNIKEVVKNATLKGITEEIYKRQYEISYIIKDNTIKFDQFYKDIAKTKTLLNEIDNLIIEYDKYLKSK